MLRVEDIPDDGIMIYDIETDSQYPTYCKLEMVSYQLGLGNEPQVVDLASKTERDRLRGLLRDPDILKVSYYGINFDDIVLMRYGFYVEPKGRHDMFLALKTVAPSLPSHSLKFANWYYFGDWHEPQRKLEGWLMHQGMKRKQLYQAPQKLLARYCQHDVRQTANIFRMVWEIVQRPEHWDVYCNMELAMADPLHEMVLFAGEWIDRKDVVRRLMKLKVERQRLLTKTVELSKGKIKNAASSLQVSQYLHDVDQVDLELSKAGNYSVRKENLIELLPTNRIAKCVYEIRDVSKVIQYYENYLRAAQHEHYGHGDDNFDDNLLPFDHRISLSKRSHIGSNGNGHVAIPKGYTMSSARTRRFQSASRFGINFQNQNKRTKVVQLVPDGWLGCWIDSRQIENVVHIWASNDDVRRAAYEADPDWNEYVWLTNQVLGTDHSRKELEAILCPLNPNMSMYKQYKQIKLAMNFFMGPAKFARLSGITEEQAYAMFEEVHEACPAIRRIANILQKEVQEKGCIRDPFGHIYGGSSKSQMTVVHLVQGCGTGSIPKAMTIANYRTLHSLDSEKPVCRPCLWNGFRKRYSYGVVCGTTHDECAFRISLGLPEEMILRLVKECLYNMEEKFSPLFDNIPLRAQLALSLTNASEQTELNHRDSNFEDMLHEWITVGKSKVKNSVSKTD